MVLIELKDGTSDEQVAAMLDGMAALPASIPVIRSVVAGRDAGISATPIDVSFVATFDSAADYDAYRAHPAHGAFASELLRPVAERITISQFESGT